MKTLEELRRERAAKVKELTELRSKAGAEKRAMTPEEVAKFDALDKEQQSLAAEILIAQRIADLEGEMRQSTTTQVIEPTPSAPAANGAEKRFASLGDQLLAVAQAELTRGRQIDPRLVEHRSVTGLGETIPSDGAYLVQADFMAGLIKRIYDTSVMAKRCTRVTVSGNRLVANGIDESSRVDGSRYGGIQAYWRAEADLITKSKPKFRQMNMALESLAAVYYATEEILEDATALEGLVTEAIVSELGFKLDDAIVNGDGAGKPLGVLSSPARVDVAIESGPQTTDTIVLANLAKMDARLWARSDPNAEWFINQDTKPQLQQISLTVGNNSFPAFMPMSSGITGRQPGTLYGKPVTAIEQAATLGDLGDINLWDMSQYLLIEKGAAKSDVSIHVRFEYLERVFRFYLRVNGQPLWNVALTPFKGSNTQSPFVSLATR